MSSSFCGEFLGSRDRSQLQNFFVAALIAVAVTALSFTAIILDFDLPVRYERVDGTCVAVSVYEGRNLMWKECGFEKGRKYKTEYVRLDWKPPTNKKPEPKGSG